MNRLVVVRHAVGRFCFLGVCSGHTGVINLGPEEILKAGGQEIVVPGYSVPSFEDWNNDGREDLIVGEGGAGRHREDPRLPQRRDRNGPLLRRTISTSSRAAGTSPSRRKGAWVCSPAWCTGTRMTART